MRVLALDTATEACSVALFDGSAVILRHAEVGRGHADEVLAMVDAVLDEADIPLRSLDGIAAGIGPGSFTGVRISVSVAQGLAFGAGLPVIPVSSLEALAWRAVGEGASKVLACLDARMGELYWGCFAADAARGLVLLGTLEIGPPPMVRWPEATPFRGIGRGFAAYPELAVLSGLALEPGDAQALPHAREIASLGALRLQAGEGLDPAELKPRYVRDKVALTEIERRASK